MYRFYIPPEDCDWENKMAVIRGEEFKHFSRVLRLSLGAQIIVFDGCGRESQAEVVAIKEKQALVKLTKPSFFAGESKLEIWLGQSLVKGDKMNLIIQKSTELGFRGLIPLQTEHSVVKLSLDKEKKRREKWEKVALAAAKQCGRSVVPAILPISTLQDFLNDLPVERHLLIPWEKGGIPLRQALEKINFSETAFKKPLYFLIGPEGGWDSREVALVEKKGGIPVSLGSRILRTETAGPIVLAVLMFAGRDWG
ncbi:MAG TPA: 16S rRNA (uracil(1498)-N(3))-methyltransferase [Clostridia bacterium]|jgi:16S rRNA (uracil1498-N3)-methyltransferase|nr:16S rRNA (uracil(1498)-N(3))-methyltransferase [Clostridia bacterium]